MLMMKRSVMMMILMKDTADSSGRWRLQGRHSIGARCAVSMLNPLIKPAQLSNFLNKYAEKWTRVPGFASAPAEQKGAPPLH